MPQLDTAAIWKSAEEAIVVGNDETLGHLLAEHDQMFRTARPPKAWFGGLTPNDTADDARALIAREHYCESWPQYREFARQVNDRSSLVALFEESADAIASGDETLLSRALKERPQLIRARSIRSHHSTLLHYVGANGIEGWRQRTPKNAVRMADILIAAGAEVDAEADMYNGGCTTLGLVATSCHPRDAGVQTALIDILIAHGARVDAPAGGHNNLIVNGCLANGRPEAAEYLSKRGAVVNLEGAAGIGRLDLVKTFFDVNGQLKSLATVAQLKDGFTWACEYGHADVVDFLLEHGVSAADVLPRPHRQTGLHWAAYGGHVATVRVLLRRRPPLDVRDASFDGTPLDWALHGWWERRNQDAARREPFYQVVAMLVAAGASVDRQRLREENERADPRMLAALRGTLSA